MKDHALLSASGSERWLNCTPSARMEEKIEDTESVFAQEGTAAHHLVEVLNRVAFNPGELSEKQYKLQLNEVKNSPYYNAEMDEHAKAFNSFIAEELTAAKKIDKNAFIDFEVRLDYSKYVPEGFGTGDVIIIADDTLQIIDFKYGKGVFVEAEENSQMLLYALGAILEYSMVYPIDNIKMIIYQPRLDNISTNSIKTKDLMEWAESTLKEKALLAYDGAGDFIPGDHCRFCKIKATCRALAEHNLKLQAYEYKDPNLLSLEEIGDIIKIADRLKSWTEDIKSYALDQALAGQKIPGFKVVEGRSNRGYLDEPMIAKILKKNKFKVTDIFERKLIGITKMEKLLGKQTFDSLLSDYVVKPDGKPTLVPITDKRPEFISAEIDFKDIDLTQL